MSKPYRPNRRSSKPLDGEVIYERRDLDRKRESSRESMRRLRAERRRLAAQEALAALGAAADTVDGNNSEE